MTKADYNEGSIRRIMEVAKVLENIVKSCIPEVPVYDKTKGLSYLFANLPVDGQIILYGAGQDAEEVFSYLSRLKDLFGFCDRDTEKQRLGFHGYKVISPDE